MFDDYFFFVGGGGGGGDRLAFGLLRWYLFDVLILCIDEFV